MIQSTLNKPVSSLELKVVARSETELNQWVQSEKEKLAMVMRENEIEWDQKGTHEPHLLYWITRKRFENRK